MVACIPTRSAAFTGMLAVPLEGRNYWGYATATRASQRDRDHRRPARSPLAAGFASQTMQHRLP